MRSDKAYDPRQRGMLRVVGICFAAFLVAGAPLAQIAHFVLVPHEICEHGELVHVALGAGSSGAGATTLGVARALVRHVLGWTNSGDAGDHEREHGHCLVGAMARISVTAPNLPAPFQLASVDRSPSVADPSEVATCVSRAILLDAPKTSPPAV